MTLGNYIKMFRDENGLTQKELAEELGIPGSNSDICRLERGSERPLLMAKARFLVYVTTGKYWVCRKETAKYILINVDDLLVSQREYLRIMST